MNKLTLITVNLNNADGLQKTVQSVIDQTWKEFEYIIIDGSSSDGSLEIIQQFINPAVLNFRWVSEPDSGVYEAMNKGIQMATGEYLLFLNSGDFLVNGKVLESVFSVSHTADFLLGQCHVSENGSIIRTTDPPQKITFGYLYNNGLAHQSTFIKKEMFEKYGYYREDFRFNSDVEFWYRTIVLKSCPTETLSTVISDYNTDGMSSKLRGTDAFQKEMIEIFSQPTLQLFIPDYNEWLNERQEMSVMYWVKSKKLIFGLLLNMYKFVRWFAKVRK